MPIYLVSKLISILEGKFQNIKSNPLLGYLLNKSSAFMGTGFVYLPSRTGEKECEIKFSHTVSYYPFFRELCVFKVLNFQISLSNFNQGKR